MDCFNCKIDELIKEIMQEELYLYQLKEELQAMRNKLEGSLAYIYDLQQHLTENQVSI